VARLVEGVQIRVIGEGGRNAIFCLGDVLESYL